MLNTPFISAKDIFRELDGLGLPKSDIYDILSFISTSSYEEVIKNLAYININSSDYSEVLQKIKSDIPPAYITSRRGFYGRDFFVNTDVLIPRYETETLIELVLEHYPDKKRKLKILDLCTGSGCILLTLLSEYKNAIGVGVDISAAALTVANINREKLSINDRADFIKLDVLSDDFTINDFDIITFNPPYLSSCEYQNAEKSLYYEPCQALVAEDNGLVFYKNLLSKLATSSNINARVYMEIGYSQSAAIDSYAKSCAIELKTLQDLAGNDRVMWGFINKNC